MIFRMKLYINNIQFFIYYYYSIVFYKIARIDNNLLNFIVLRFLF